MACPKQSIAAPLAAAQLAIDIAPSDTPLR